MPDPTRARIEGYTAGVRETLDTLERAGCLTTAHAKRFTERLRRQMTSERDTVPSPEREALERMHRYLYPEHYSRHPRPASQWNAATIEVAALILNEALGYDTEGRNAEQQAEHRTWLDRQPRDADGRLVPGGVS